MKILGIDYGRKKIGLAIGETESRFAEPLMVFRFTDEEKALNKVTDLSKLSNADRVVLGVPEGKMASEIKVFGKKLKSKLAVPIYFFDETLSTIDAQNLSLKAGIGRKRRKDMEDAFAAAVMLQNYLEQSF